MAAWPSPAVFVAAGLVSGLGVGNLITLPPLLAREEFGQRSFGTVFGLVGAATQAGVAAGPASWDCCGTRWRATSLHSGAPSR